MTSRTSSRSRDRAEPGLAASVDPDLKGLLRQVKLGRLLDTLPERLALARLQSLPHQDFLTLLLADEVERRDRTSAELRARTAKLDLGMRATGKRQATGKRLNRSSPPREAYSKIYE